jgi:hypothetical protein
VGKMQWQEKALAEKQGQKRVHQSHGTGEYKIGILRGAKEPADCSERSKMRFYGNLLVRLRDSYTNLVCGAPTIQQNRAEFLFLMRRTGERRVASRIGSGRGSLRSRLQEGEEAEEEKPREPKQQQPQHPEIARAIAVVIVWFDLGMSEELEEYGLSRLFDLRLSTRESRTWNDGPPRDLDPIPEGIAGGR